MCAIKDNLFREMVSAGATYRIALSGLRQDTSPDAVNGAINHANQAYEELTELQEQLARHIREHGCGALTIDREAHSRMHA